MKIKVKEIFADDEIDVAEILDPYFDSNADIFSHMDVGREEWYQYVIAKHATALLVHALGLQDTARTEIKEGAIDDLFLLKTGERIYGNPNLRIGDRK